MRLGQTSAIHFGSQVASSLAGFVATLYVAQNLGSSVLGRYALFVAVLIWLKTIVGSGVQQAITKRASETEGGGRDIGAGIVIEAALFLIVVVLLVAFSGPLNDYLEFAATTLLIVALALVLLFSLVNAALHGDQLVHLAALLRPVDRIVRSGVQLAVVFLGILGGGVVGLVWGYIAGVAVVVVVGALLVSTRPRMPRRENIERIAGFTRYSWLSGIEERSFSAMDTIVLGFFVSQSLIGYYEVAWNIVSLLAIFGTSIAQAMFPLLSQLDSENLDESVAGLINDSLAFSGLFLIPGVVGSFLVGEHILGIYGAEFRQATTVLVLLAVARLVYAYESQFITSLNALDFPGAAFRVNVVFVLANLGLNVALVAAFGWLGAAVGTGLAATIGLVLGYRVLADRIEFRVPTYEIGYQTLAAVVMAIAVVAIQPVFISGQYGSVPETLALVGAGASVYVVALLVLSVRFRTVVADNLSITSTMD